MPYQKAKSDQPYGDGGEPVNFSELPTVSTLYTFDNVAPPDSSIAPGQLVGWFDPTDGAAVFKIKGKTLNGTVVNGSINLT